MYFQLEFRHLVVNSKSSERSEESRDIKKKVTITCHLNVTNVDTSCRVDTSTLTPSLSFGNLEQGSLGRRCTRRPGTSSPFSRYGYPSFRHVLRILGSSGLSVATLGQHDS